MAPVSGTNRVPVVTSHASSAAKSTLKRRVVDFFMHPRGGYGGGRSNRFTSGYHGGYHGYRGGYGASPYRGYSRGYGNGYNSGRNGFFTTTI